MAKYPDAEWVPWKYNSASGPTYFSGSNDPAAVVLHIMQGYARTARQWALEGHYGASWHFTVGRDGHVMQHLEFADGGYQAGIPAGSSTPTWRYWRGPSVNVNNYTLGIEHEGFSGEPFSPEQAEASKNLCYWLAGQLGIPVNEDYFPPHAAIDVVNRADDFNIPALRAEHYAYLMEEEDEMTPELEARLARIEDGLAQLRTQSWGENAPPRQNDDPSTPANETAAYVQYADGTLVTFASLRDKSGSGAGTGVLPEHTHKGSITGGVNR